MNPTSDFRSRNPQKPSPVSQRIQGFENNFNGNKVPRSTDVYAPQSKPFRSTTIENSSLIPEPVENTVIEGNDSLRLNIDCKNENIAGKKLFRKEVITINKDSSMITSNSKQNSISKQYSLKTANENSSGPDIIRNRLYRELPLQSHSDNIAKDENQTIFYSPPNKQVMSGGNFPDHNTAYKSHPYHKALNKSIVTTIHSSSRSRADSVASQSDKPESIGAHYKKNSSGIYKPVYSRQTRYPNPTKVESTHFPPNSIIRSHHQINLQTGHSKNGNASYDDFSMQRSNVSKLFSTKMTTPGADLSSCRTNPSLNKLQSHNPNIINIRAKAQNRIFEPENMDFSQLSTNGRLNNPPSGEKVNSFSDLSTSKAVEIPMKMQTVHSSEEGSITNTNCRDAFEHSNSKTVDEKNLKICPNLNFHNACIEKGKLFEPENTNHSPILNRIISDDLTNESESSGIPKCTAYFIPPVVDTDANHIHGSNHNDHIDSNSLNHSTLPKLSKLERQSIIINTLSTNRSSYNLKDSICRLFTINGQETTHPVFDFHSSTNVQYCRPLSFAKIDVQNWIKDTIVMKDSVTAAFLISSHIFEKISFYIAQRHALERKETDYIIHGYQAQVKGLLDINIVLRNKLFFLLFENVKASTLHNHIRFKREYKIRRMCSLPTTLNDHVSFPSFPNSPKLSFHRINECLGSDVLLPIHSKDANDVGSTPNMHSTDSSIIIQYYPSPPPDLPELESRKIPQPPPNLPITEQRLQNDSESSPFFKPMKFKMGVNLKPLHWKRLSLPNRKNKVEIVWKMLPRQKIKPNDLTLFEESFSTQPPRKVFKSMKNQNSHSTKLPREILPQEIARQLGIVCKNFEGVHTHLEDIEEMLYSGDFKRSNLTISILESLSKLVTDERIRLVYDYVSKNPKVELTKESRTIHFFSNIPHVTMRFQHILYMQNFEEDIEHIHGNLNTIYHCCSKLRNSYELRILLSIILVLGNYMNQTYNSFKEAVGFNLELLPRLKETKTMDNSSTFLDFVSRCYLLNFEHNISQGSITNILPFPDTGDLFVASKITLNEVYDGLSNLGDQLTKIRENTRHFLQDTSDGRSNEYVELVERFFQFAEKKISSEIDFWRVGDKTYQELILYFYGESKVSGCHPDTSDFFGLWCNFASSFKEALMKEHKNIAIKRRSAFIKSDTKIVPLCPSGLKQKVRYRSASKSRFYNSTKSLNNN